jgi:saccharopine dehydrogenase-like NADP-dependent oxidoreductase
VADFRAGVVPTLKDGKIIAAVRSEEQAAAFSDSGVTVIRLDLADGEAVKQAIIENNGTSNFSRSLSLC